MDPARLSKLYEEYVDGFRSEGVLPPLMQLKLDHTMRVVENAKAIAKGEGLDDGLSRLCESAALLHDTGRYEQIRKYNTFRDSESTDHAVLSHGIVKELGWLDGEPGGKIVLDAVLFHNRKELPEGMERAASIVANCVRDADKLDIFRVFEEQTAETDWRGENAAFWSLPVFAPPSPEVLEGVKTGKAVDYKYIRTLADFVLVQIGWLKCELHFASSRRLALERGHLAFRRRFLAELTGGNAEVDALCRPEGGEMTLDDVESELRCGNRVLLMVRHGERKKIDNDDPTFGMELALTDEGRRTATLFGERFKDFAGETQFMTSPLLRTRQTARCIAEGMGLGDIEIPEDGKLGNETFYFADQREVFELFRDGDFFEEIFRYMAEGRNRGFVEIGEATDALEEWALGKFTAKLGIFATHDVYNGAFLHARGVKTDWTMENWVRFLDCAAIIVEPGGAKRYGLVRSGFSQGTVGVS